MAKVPELEEAQLKIDTIAMYKSGGIINVLDCIDTMRRCEIIILEKLNEILDNEENNEL